MSSPGSISDRIVPAEKWLPHKYLAEAPKGGSSKQELKNFRVRQLTAVGQLTTAMNLGGVDADAVKLTLYVSPRSLRRYESGGSTLCVFKRLRGVDDLVWRGIPHFFRKLRENRPIVSIPRIPQQPSIRAGVFRFDLLLELCLSEFPRVKSIVI